MFIQFIHLRRFRKENFKAFVAGNGQRAPRRKSRRQLYGATRAIGNYHRWTAEEDAHIAALPQASAAELASRFGVFESTATARRAKLRRKNRAMGQ